ncbi:hypothetical protein QO207_30970 [Pseudomonas sp. CAN2814]|uniref:hypothetical protein n=1 Tax=Pseudomonas sp. CAN1 TaxID=3046726 RepID=UPI002649CE4F|nr:hypothetical protein [Pseudomonas sp. CAN1]MDN6861035.1 hypothetical protein [Pseudomonas sp. CAN1]
MEQKDWDDLQAQMDTPYGSMELQCDQFKVSLVQHSKPASRKWVTYVFVDGHYKGAWSFADENGEPKHEEARRFLRKSSKAFFSTKEIEAYRKTFGKRRATELAAKRHVWFHADWTSFNSLKKHLIANNTSIQRIE